MEKNSDLATATVTTTTPDGTALTQVIKAWGRELGFSQVGICDTDLSLAEPALQAWLDAGYHGTMNYMATHGTKRSRPAELVPGTLRIISVSMNYLPPNNFSTQRFSTPDEKKASAWQMDASWKTIQRSEQAYIAHYARGRDYHKVMRSRLQQLAERIAAEVGAFGYRVFTDSAPVLEVELARKAGVGWRGKHTLMLNRDSGSMFFLGEIYTDLPLPIDAPVTPHCGTCQQCMDICPTQAIIAPYQLDARRCIAYLTIELQGSIPVEFRRLIGNRIYGCDDCQLICPWNKYAQVASVPDFAVRHGFDDVTLVTLFHWSETQFEQSLQGSAMRRIGYEQWLRNIAVGLGNTATTPAVVQALQERAEHPSALVREHVLWALQQHEVGV